MLSCRKGGHLCWQAVHRTRSRKPGCQHCHSITYRRRVPACYLLDAETAQAMARAAYRRAAKLSAFGADIVGVGCTCALATDREKQGDHKAFVTTYNGLQERR